MTDHENAIKWKEYFYNGTEVLINNFNVKNSEELKEVEATISFKKLYYLNNLNISEECNKQHLKRLHYYVFSDIYPFAGKFRNVNLIKRYGSFLKIENDNTIDNYLDELFNEIELMLSRCQSKQEFSNILSILYTRLIYCHPFREGNGRTIREFVREFSITKSRNMNFGCYELDWSLINKEELNKFIEVAHIYSGLIAIMFNQALVENTDEINKKSK